MEVLPWDLRDFKGLLGCNRLRQNLLYFQDFQNHFALDIEHLILYEIFPLR